MYNLVDYGRMLEDRVRVRAIAQALETVVPGRSVLELGGGTGYFACLASKLGATTVSSVDMNPLIRLGPRTATANGLGNIHFYFGRSQELKSSEKFDVLLHDLRGNTPFFANSLATVRDARRLLSPEAAFLPSRDVVYAALVEDEAFYRQMEGVWGGCLEGLDLRAFRGRTHRLMRYVAGSESRNWGKVPLVEIDYRTFEKLSLETSFRLKAGFDGSCHGLVLWFDTVLTPDIGYSNDPWLAPERRGSTYGVAFLPWSEPVKMVKGSLYSVEVSISSQGQYTAILFLQQGSFQRKLGSFLPEEDSSEVLLPLDGKFEKMPSAATYRTATRAIEQGRSVRAALKEIEEAGEHRDVGSAAAVLRKSHQLLQGAIHRKRSRKLILACRDRRLQVQTWDRDLEKAVADALSPGWTRLKRTTKSLDSIVVERVIHSGGLSISVEFRNTKTLHTELQSALVRVETIATETVLAESQDSLVLDCGYLVEDQGISLLFDDDRARRWQMVQRVGPALAHGTRLCIFDLAGRFLPYATWGEKLPEPPANRVRRLFFSDERAASKAVALATVHSRCLNRGVLDSPLKYFHRFLQEVEIAVEQLPATNVNTPDLDFPWYDSNWHRRLRLTQQAIIARCPEKLKAFNQALDVFQTRQDFVVTKLPQPLLDAATLEKCRDIIKRLPRERHETHEIQSMGRLVVHDHPFFTRLQKQFVALVSEVAGEPVEPYYNFLSLYQELGSCEVHMDTPEAKWTLDVCIDQSGPWPIWFSQIRPWPRLGEYQGEDWARQIRNDPKNVFTEQVLLPGEGLIFSGSSQWHFRDPISGPPGQSFCHLVFFHYIPAGSRELLLEKNWSRLFGLPFDTTR